MIIKTIYNLTIPLFRSQEAKEMQASDKEISVFPEFCTLDECEASCSNMVGTLYIWTSTQENLSLEFPTRSYLNQRAQLQTLARKSKSIE